MSTETLDSPAVVDEGKPTVSFESALENIFSDLPAEKEAPAAPEVPAGEPPEQAAAPPLVEDPAKAEEKQDPPAKGFKALREQKDREREEAIAALRAEYETKLAEATGKAVSFESTANSNADKLAAAEALKAAHEKRVQELEQQEIEDYETPYSIEVDPEAIPVLSAFASARAGLDAAVAQAATSLGEDQRSVQAIAGNKALFGQILAEMTHGLVPDAVHAEKLVDGMRAVGVMISHEEARLAVRDLKAVLPNLYRLRDAQQSLQAIKAKNEPNWQSLQAARHEAYRRHITGAAEVADDAVEGDDAVVAGILKAKPELRDILKAEADRLSGMVIGPAPGKATATAIRAAPRALHETALKAARLPVVVAAYREAEAKLAAGAARIAELEARLGEQGGTVPRPAGTGATATKARVDFNAGLAALFPNA